MCLTYAHGFPGVENLLSPYRRITFNVSPLCSSLHAFPAVESGALYGSFIDIVNISLRPLKLGRHRTGQGSTLDIGL